MDIEEFYEADERRRRSEEIELGTEWHDRDAVRHEVSWVADTGELYVMREPAAPMGEDSSVTSSPGRFPTDAVTVAVVGWIPTATSAWRRSSPGGRTPWAAPRAWRGWRTDLRDRGRAQGSAGAAEVDAVAVEPRPRPLPFVLVGGVRRPRRRRRSRCRLSTRARLTDANSSMTRPQATCRRRGSRSTDTNSVPPARIGRRRSRRLEDRRLPRPVPGARRRGGDRGRPRRDDDAVILIGARRFTRHRVEVDRAPRPARRWAAQAVKTILAPLEAAASADHRRGPRRAVPLRPHPVRPVPHLGPGGAAAAGCRRRRLTADDPRRHLTHETITALDGQRGSRWTWSSRPSARRLR